MPQFQSARTNARTNARKGTSGPATGDRCVLHIGVPKTGTTAIQAALAQLQESDGGRGLQQYGVSMPGTPTTQARAALSVLGLGVGWSARSDPVSWWHWDRLVRQVRSTPGTTLVSSEYLCEADARTVGRVVRDLEQGDLQVVVTLRPMTRILPSAWQQYLKSGHQLPYDDWLRAVLATPPKKGVTPSFWRRHDQAAVVERWAGEVGAGRLVVVVLDDAERSLLPQAFDRLLGLPEGTLEQWPSPVRNRSMTAAEAELFRRVNVALRGAKVDWADYSHLVRYGAILRAVEQAAPTEGSLRITTPAWALGRAAELGAGYGERIALLEQAGLTVVGDLARLTGDPSPTTPMRDDVRPRPVELLPIDVAVQAVLGTVARAATGTAFLPGEGAGTAGVSLPGMPGGGRLTQPDDERPAEPAADRLRSVPVGRLTAPDLARVLAGRVRDGVARRGRGVLTRLRRES